MANSVIVNVHIMPLGSGTSISQYVKGCLEPLKKAKGVTYQIGAMGTVIQGPLNDVLEIIKKMEEAPFTMGAKRVVTNISIDDRRDKAITIESKIKAVT
jgi:uncharacterized protein (TIGR00106 family)